MSGLTPMADPQALVPVTLGGTGLTSYAIGDLLYASATTTLAKLADVAVGNALISGGVGVAPAWGKIALTTHVSGVLPQANGGTGVANAGTLTNASNTTVTGGGTLALGGFTLTVPATGTAALLGSVNAFSSTLTVVDGNLSITGSADATKRLKFEVDAQATASTLTIESGAQTVDRTLTVPVLGGNRTMGVIGVNNVDWLNPVNVTGTTTIAASGVWKKHLCTGTSADYTITLPSSGMAAGDLMVFQMGTDTTLTRIVTLDAGAGRTIDGVQTRLMWAKEVAVLQWDGAAWVKVAGKSIPMSCVMNRATAQSITQSTWTQISTTTVVHDNTSALAVPFSDTTNGRAKVIRPGKYYASGFASVTGVAVNTEVNGGVAKNAALPADNPNAFCAIPAPAGGNVQATGSGCFDCAAADWLGVIVFQADAAARNTRAVGTVLPSLSVTEIVTW